MNLLSELCSRVWEAYKKLRGTDTVIRSGFGLCGCYPYTTEPDPSAPARPESVAEHTLGTMSLLYLMSVFFPGMFACAHKPPTTSLEHESAQLRAFQMMSLLMFHDIGETASALGDRPDDGSQNRAEKDAIELDTLADLTKNFPLIQRNFLCANFRQFQDPLNPDATDVWTPLYGDLVQLARLCDKVDAILGAIMYERAGHDGDLRFKLEHFGSITDQDQRYIDAAQGDSSVPAVWAAHIAHDYHAYYGFRELMGVVRAAVIDTRGAWFPWWRPYCAELNIPNNNW